jgi:hypothetical protein
MRTALGGPSGVFASKPAKTPGRSSRSLIIDGRHLFLQHVARNVIEGADIAGNNRRSRRTCLAVRVAIRVSRLV